MKTISTRGDPDIQELLGGRSLKTRDSLGWEAERESTPEVNENEGLVSLVGHGRSPGLYPISFTSRSNCLPVLPVELCPAGTGRLSHGGFSILRGTAADALRRS
jgi:hypothetical protein